jgi:hypothetical protein
MPDEDVTLHFPKAGVDRSGPFGRQPARPVGDGEYARTAYLGVNVRAHEALTGRRRGGSRAGLSKFRAATVAGAAWIVQQLDVIVGNGFTPPGGGMAQGSQSGRVVLLVAVSQGDVYTTLPGGTTWNAATNNTGNTPPLNFTGLMMSAANQQKLWYVDGVNFAVYVPATDSVESWTASGGSLPVDGDSNAPRLIATWRGRTVLSGLLKDPQNIFFSKVGDPTNFDYAPVSPSAIDAVAMNLAQFGLIGDLVTALIPFSDDVLIVGTDHEVWSIQGDPAAGGSANQVTSAVGIAWGQAWCQDPTGRVYFFSNRTGVFSMVPGEQPQRLSAPIDNLLYGIDTGSYGVRLLWNDRFQGLHVFVTPLAEPGATTHYFWEQRTGAWWQDTLANHDHDPLCCCVLDGNLPTDRVALLGCWDGYVRAFDPTATDDDGTAIASEVWIGPLLSADLDDILVREIQGVLGETSGQVTWEVYSGATAEAARGATAFASGTWAAGRNLTDIVRSGNHAHYVRVSSTVPWAMEAIRTVLGGRGKVRRRGA